MQKTLLTILKKILIVNNSISHYMEHMKDNNKKFIILTGLSGAGKSTAIKYLEDAGFFCVDNFLPTLLPNIAHICIKSDIRKVALVIDARGGDFYKQLVRALKKLKLYKIKYRIIFLEAKDDSIIRRFSETRRKHPLSDKGRVSLGIKKERHILEKVRSISDRIIDTTNMLPKQLNYEIYSEISTDKKDAGHFNITVLSFGYKYGIPVDSDLVFDVRFIPNPYYVKKLQNYTGLTY